jgi:sarcosine oxidase gamma subunit
MESIGDKALEEAILRLLAARGREKTICPSEAARAVAPGEWQIWMEPVREAAQRLAAAGMIVITQGGAVVDGYPAKGPIRLRLR